MRLTTLAAIIVIFATAMTVARFTFPATADERPAVATEQPRVSDAYMVSLINTVGVEQAFDTIPPEMRPAPDEKCEVIVLPLCDCSNDPPMYYVYVPVAWYNAKIGYLADHWLLWHCDIGGRVYWSIPYTDGEGCPDGDAVFPDGIDDTIWISCSLIDWDWMNCLVSGPSWYELTGYWCCSENWNWCFAEFCATPTTCGWHPYAG